MLHPRYRFRRITQIPPDWLIQRGISVLLLDVDNTLTTHNSPDVSQDVVDWIARIQEKQIQMLIFSNNSSARVKPLAEQLGLGYISRACKPLGFTVKRACKQMQVGREKIAVVGDQIFTDVLCANGARVVSILVEPFEAEQYWGFRIKRRMEKLVLGRARVFGEDKK